MPAGTTVDLTAAGSGGVTVSPPASFVVPSYAGAAGSKFSGTTLFSFGLTTQPTTSGTSVITLTVTTPKKVVTFVQISVVVS
jgi:hypothetical protein